MIYAVDMSGNIFGGIVLLCHLMFFGRGLRQTVINTIVERAGTG